MKKIIVFAMLFLMTCSLAFADTNVSACGTLGSAGTTYNVVNNLTASGTCLTIGANDIVLDCHGFSIDGGGGYTLIYIPSKINTTIKNCVLKSSAWGIRLSYSTDVFMSNITAYDNYMGIYLNNANGGYVEDSTFFNNHVFGIQSYSSNNFIFRNIDMHDNVDAVFNAGEGSDFNFRSIVPTKCNFVFDNVTSSGKQVKFYNSSVSISDEEVGGLILCNANNSVFTNMNISGGYGSSFMISSTDNASFVNLNEKNITNFQAYYASNLKFKDSIFNYRSTFDIVPRIASDCNYIFDNVRDENGKDVLFYNDSSNLTDLDNPTLILCNADNSSISHSNIRMLYVHSTDGLDIHGINLTDSKPLPWIASSSDVNITDSWIVTQLCTVLSMTNNVNMFNNYIKINATNEDCMDSYLVVVGGDVLYMNNTTGGNYYADFDGTGFSETCTDADVNGICDDPFDVYPDVGIFDYMPLSVIPNLTFPVPCSEGTHQCSGDDRQVCSSGIWTFVETCTYGCDSGSCNAPPSPAPLSLGQVIAGVGTGMGNFFDAIGSPLAYLLLVLGITGAVVGVFAAIGILLRKSIK